MTCLRNCGFEPKYKPPKIIRVNGREIKYCDWGIGITVDVVYLIDKLDTILLGTSNPDFIPLVRWCRDQGKEVIIFASCVPVSLRNVASSVIEITDLLEEEE